MNYHFISFELYPNGGAAANRHMALMKAISASEVDVHLHSVLNHVSSYRSKYFKIHSVKKTDSKIMKYFSALMFILRLSIGQLKCTRKNDRLIYLGTSGFFLIPLIIYAKFFRIPIYHERTELPELMVGNSFISKLDYFIYKNLLVRLFDGIFLITNLLKQEFMSFPGVHAHNLHILNMMVDFDRFKDASQNQSGTMKLITFCGDLGSSKDNVDILLKSFKVSLDNAPLLKLKLIGDYNNNYFKTVIKPLIADLDLEEHLIIGGYLSPELVPTELASSDLLVLSRDNSRQAQYGFPTKLGEYLASGVPVLVTATSEIGRFLQDNVNAYLVSPGDVDGFAQKIVFIARDYESAKIVGQAGRNIAKEFFCSNKMAEKFIKILGS